MNGSAESASLSPNATALLSDKAVLPSANGIFALTNGTKQSVSLSTNAMAVVMCDTQSSHNAATTMQRVPLNQGQFVQVGEDNELHSVTADLLFARGRRRSSVQHFLHPNPKFQQLQKELDKFAKTNLIRSSSGDTAKVTSAIDGNMILLTPRHQLPSRRSFLAWIFFFEFLLSENKANNATLCTLIGIQCLTKTTKLSHPWHHDQKTPPGHAPSSMH